MTSPYNGAQISNCDLRSCDMRTRQKLWSQWSSDRISAWPRALDATISVDECLGLRTSTQVPSLISGDYYTIISFFLVSHVVAWIHVSISRNIYLKSRIEKHLLMLDQHVTERAVLPDGIISCCADDCKLWSADWIDVCRVRSVRACVYRCFATC